MIVYTTDNNMFRYSDQAQTRIENGVLTIFRTDNRLVEEVITNFPLVNVQRWTP